MSEQSVIHKRFTFAMINIYNRALKEINYPATRFLQMVNDKGGYETAYALIHSSQIHDGYTKLWEHNRLDLSVEALVLHDDWRDIFTDHDRHVARTRLEQYGYDIHSQRSS